MSLPFLSEAWAQTLMARLNESEAYREAAAKWEGAIIFVVEDCEPKSYVYLDLQNGRCLAAKQLDSPDEESAPFRISAPWPPGSRSSRGS